MNVKKIFITILLSCCFALFLMGGCSKAVGVKSIELKDYSNDTPIEIFMGNFSYAGRALSVTYDNGGVEEIPLNEEMIVEADKLKFYQEGTHEISIIYEGASTQVTINVFRNTFPEDVVLNNVNEVYTGESFTIEVEGSIPNGTEIIYPQGNVFMNAGVYDVTAVLQCYGYESKVLYARVNIEKAEYDVSNAVLYNKTVEYNKGIHTLSAMGKPYENGSGNRPMELPRGVGVSYTITKIKDGLGADIIDKQVIEGNRASDAGTYEVRAKYRGETLNHKEIPDSVAYLVINKANYDTSNVVFENKNVTYTGGVHELSIANDSDLPNDVYVTYEIKKIRNGLGEAVEEKYRNGNTATDAGVYSVKVSFIISGKNSANYNTSPSEKYAFLNIELADFSDTMKKVYLDYIYYLFQEEEEYEYAVVLDGDLPIGVTPTFTIKNSDGVVIEGRMEKQPVERKDDNEKDVFGINHVYYFMVTEEGVYSCEVTFSIENENFKSIKPMETEVFIESPVVEIEVTTEGEGIPTITVGNFDYSAFKLSVDYTASEEVVELTEDMLYSEEEKAKFSKVGKQMIKFIYKGHVFEIEIEVQE